MIYAGIAFGVLFVASAIVRFIWTSFAAKESHKMAADLIEKELGKIMTRSEEEIKSLTDPDRTPTSQEVQDALRKIRDRGR